MCVSLDVFPERRCGAHVRRVAPSSVLELEKQAWIVEIEDEFKNAEAAAVCRLSSVVAVVPEIQGNARVEFEQRNRGTMIIGVGADMPAVWRMKVALGQFLPRDLFDRARAFVVLGSNMREELLGSSNPLGAADPCRKRSVPSHWGNGVKRSDTWIRSR